MEGISMLLLYIIFIQTDLCPIQFVKKKLVYPFHESNQNNYTVWPFPND